MINFSNLKPRLSILDEVDRTTLTARFDAIDEHLASFGGNLTPAQESELTDLVSAIPDLERVGDKLAKKITNQGLENFSSEDKHSLRFFKISLEILANEADNILKVQGPSAAPKSLDLIFQGIEDSVKVFVEEDEEDEEGDTINPFGLVADGFNQFVKGEDLNEDTITQMSQAFKETFPQRFVAYEPFMELCEISSHSQGKVFLSLISANLSASEAKVLDDFQAAIAKDPAPLRSSSKFEAWYNRFDVLTDEWSLSIKKDRLSSSPKPKF